MTNNHRKTTNRTTAKIAAVGAFGIGAAIAFPGLAAAQDAGTPDSPTASLENLGGEDGSLEGALGTDLNLDLGSLAFNLNLDAETPNPGSVEFGSLGVSPNTGSDIIDGGSGSGSADDDAAADSGSLGSSDAEEGTDDDAAGGSGSLGSSDAEEGTDDDVAADSGSLGSSDAEEGTETETGSAAGSADEDATETEETGSLSGSLAGLSSGAEDDATDGETNVGVDAGAAVNTGSLG